MAALMHTYIRLGEGGGELNSLERRYLETKSYTKSTVGLLCAVLK